MAEDTVAAQNNAAETAKNETAAAGIIIGGDMDWKYKNEVMIKDTDTDPIDQIEALVEKSGGERAEVYYQFHVRTEDDVFGLDYVLHEYGPKITTFEIVLADNIIKSGMPVRFFMPDGVDTRLIVTAPGDKPMDMPMITLELSADTLIVRNMKFDRQEHLGALKLSVGRLFVGENLSFSHNKFEQHMAFMSKPLIMLESRAKEGESSRYVLRNVSFIENQSDALLLMNSESRGKFESIELDHVVAKDNSNMAAGIEISATKDVLVHDCDLTGSKAAPLLYQVLPDPQVTIKNSNVSDRVYGYRPLKEHWKTDAKPVIKENLTEAEGTTYDKVP